AFGSVMSVSAGVGGERAQAGLRGRVGAGVAAGVVACVFGRAHRAQTRLGRRVRGRVGRPGVSRGGLDRVGARDRGGGGQPEQRRADEALAAREDRLAIELVVRRVLGGAILAVRHGR
ncbi:MAG: hypothetical protein ACK559_36110, partial [bacterium]